MAFLLTLCLFSCSDEQRGAVTAPQAAPQHVEPPREGGGIPVATAGPAQGEAEEPPALSTTNSPPEILTLKMEPPQVFAGTTVKSVVEVSDPQNDPVMLDFSWEKNGEILPGEVMEELDTTGMQKGDVLTVVVTPFDGKVRGESKRSRPIVILNRPPEIISLPTPSIVEGVFTYAVKATDPDGDKLIFALEEAPHGMKMDADSGLAEWIVPKDFNGKVQVKIVVTDGDAGVFQSFDLNVSTKAQ